MLLMEYVGIGPQLLLKLTFNKDEQMGMEGKSSE